jgi:hypothetical protein
MLKVTLKRLMIMRKLVMFMLKLVTLDFDLRVLIRLVTIRLKHVIGVLDQSVLLCVVLGFRCGDRDLLLNSLLWSCHVPA